MSLMLSVMRVARMGVRFASSSLPAPPAPIPATPAKALTPTQEKLMEFFDAEKNWGEREINVGRSWRAEELRVKSNVDLHKLWYVLLKERNMLLTMENECKLNFRLFPNPERIDKVDESMKNLEEVVRERNRAYHLLETGTDGERPSAMKRNAIGLRIKYRMFEHVLPKFINTPWRQKHTPCYRGNAVRQFLKRMLEKGHNEKRKAKNRDQNHVQGLIKRFPNLDLDRVKAQFPTVNLERAKNSSKSRGHFIPKEFADP